MTHFITSSQDHDHITSSNDAIWDAGTIGFGQFAIKAYQEDTPFTCSMPDPNTLRIGKGQASCDGYRWEIEGDFEDVVIENGTPGYNRIDLVVADITTAPKPDCKLIVLKGEETAGEPVAPEPLTGDLNHGDTHVQMPIRSVKLTGINPEIMDASMNVLVPYAEFRDSQYQIFELTNYVSFYKTCGLTWIVVGGINVSSGDWHVIGELPEGFRPRHNIYMPLWSNSNTGNVVHALFVNANGEISALSNNASIAGYGLICFPYVA